MMKTLSPCVVPPNSSPSLHTPTRTPLSLKNQTKIESRPREGADYQAARFSQGSLDRDRYRVVQKVRCATLGLPRTSILLEWMRGSFWWPLATLPRIERIRGPSKSRQRTAAGFAAARPCDRDRIQPGRAIA